MKPLTLLDTLFAIDGPLEPARRKLRNVGIFFHDLFFPNNVLKIRALPRSWSDRDCRMFHAMFQLLVDFVELEQPFRDWRGPHVKRVTDVQAMRDWIEKHYNSPEAKQEYYCDWYTDEEKVQADLQLASTYNTYREILDLYDWYKAKGYELDHAGLYEKTGEKHVFTDKGMQTVDTGKPKLITWIDVAKAEEAHDKFCDEQLARVLRVRRYLWT